MAVAAVAVPKARDRVHFVIVGKTGALAQGLGGLAGQGQGAQPG